MVSGEHSTDEQRSGQITGSSNGNKNLDNIKKKNLNLNYFKPDKIFSSQSCEEDLEGQDVNEADHYELEMDISNSNEFLNL